MTLPEMKAVAVIGEVLGVATLMIWYWLRDRKGPKV